MNGNYVGEANVYEQDGVVTVRFINSLGLGSQETTGGARAAKPAAVAVPQYEGDQASVAAVLRDGWDDLVMADERGQPYVYRPFVPRVLDELTSAADNQDVSAGEIRKALPLAVREFFVRAAMKGLRNRPVHLRPVEPSRRKVQWRSTDVNGDDILTWYRKKGALDDIEPIVKLSDLETSTETARRKR